MADENDAPKNSRRGAIIGFIVFLVLLILLIVFAIYWFFFREVDNPLIRPCTTTNQCSPYEICNSDSGLCEAVSCTLNSECSGIAAGYGFCVNGYCQPASCFSNNDCDVLDQGDLVCVNFEADPATPWLTSACVRTGNDCADNLDCLRGETDLVCVPGTNNGNVCQQCGGNSDCATGLCIDGRCVNCSDSSVCGNGDVCLNGTCCDGGKTYMVNGVESCTQGIPFDYCLMDGDCASGKCVSLGSTVAGDPEVKLCAPPGGTKLFSAGTTVMVGDPSVVAGLTCDAPAGPNDSSALPFAVNGVCSFSSNTSATGAGIGIGSACGKPSYCQDGSPQVGNFLCGESYTVNNPWEFSCVNDGDCLNAGNATTCDTDRGVCTVGCSVNNDCPVGFVCGNGFCRYPNDRIQCTANSQCPSGFVCSGNSKSSICTFDNGGDTDLTPPPPFVINTFCTRPATASSGDLANYNPGYCVSGFCSSYPGWIGNVCVQDNDCMLTDAVFPAGERTSLVCGEMKVCLPGLVN
jgi:Cys-rich repeat protein